VLYSLQTAAVYFMTLRVLENGAKRSNSSGPLDHGGLYFNLT